RHTRSKRDWSSDVCSSDLGRTASTGSDLARTRSTCKNEGPILTTSEGEIMSEFESDMTDRPDEDPILDAPEVDEPTAAELDDPELNAAEVEAEQVETDIDDDEPGEPDVEAGAHVAEGTGVEGAGDVLLEEADQDDENDEPGLSDEFNTDHSPAAEQGTRVGDEMVSEGDDDFDVSELDGDDLNVDALADDGTEEVSVIDGMPEVIDDSYEED